MSKAKAMTRSAPRKKTKKNEEEERRTRVLAFKLRDALIPFIANTCNSSSSNARDENIIEEEEGQKNVSKCIGLREKLHAFISITLEEIIRDCASNDDLEQLENSVRNIEKENVTCLMVACDAGKSELLSCLLEISGWSCEKASFPTIITREFSVVRLAIGRFEEMAAESIGGNTVFHFAAANGHLECLQSLNNFEREEAYNCASLESLHIHELRSNGVKRPLLFYARNSNGDSPCMVAVVQGRMSNHRNNDRQDNFLDFFLNEFTSMQMSLINETLPPLYSLEVCPFTKFTNKNLNTVLSLSVGYGEAFFLKKILKEIVSKSSSLSQLELLKTEKERCKELIRRGKLVEADNNQSYNVGGVREHVQKCFAILREHYELAYSVADERSHMLADELMSQLGNNDTKKSFSPVIKPGRSNKSRGKKIRNGVKIESGHFKKEQENEDDQKSKVPSSTYFVTLEDGNVVANHKQALSQVESVSKDSDDFTVRGKSVSDHSEEVRRLFEDICPDAEALCLDPKAIFLSSHGMAMNLSPCQLEVIVNLLMEQLGNAQKAKKIQATLRNSLSNVFENNSK